jgi:hypothetical protein
MFEMGNFLRKKEKYNLNPSLILEFAKNQYSLIKELIEIMESDFKSRNVKTPILFLKEFVIKLESLIGFCY